MQQPAGVDRSEGAREQVLASKNRQFTRKYTLTGGKEEQRKRAIEVKNGSIAQPSSRQLVVFP
jgi:hypothetical protein